MAVRRKVKRSKASFIWMLGSLMKVCGIFGCNLDLFEIFSSGLSFVDLLIVMNLNVL